MILLKRNNETDKHFSANNDTDYFKPGESYELLSIKRFYSKNTPATVKFKVKRLHSNGYMTLAGNLNCFDYVKQVNQ